MLSIFGGGGGTAKARKRGVKKGARKRPARGRKKAAAKQAQRSSFGQLPAAPASARGRYESFGQRIVRQLSGR